MQYLLISCLLLVYFELFGQALLSFFDIQKNRYNFALGFFAFIGILYVCYFPFVFFKTSSMYVILITGLLVALSLILMYFQRKNISFKSDRYFIVFISILIVQIAIFSFHSIGDLYIKDSLTYTNMVGMNISTESLNSIDPDSGLFKLPNAQYSFQSYYLFASVICGIFGKILNTLGIRFMNFGGYIWIFSTLLYAIKICVLSNVIETLKIKNLKTTIFLVLFWIVFYGTLSSNIEGAFYGNTYRTYVCALMLLYIYKFYIEDNRNILKIYILLSYAACAVASCNIQLVCIFSYVVMVVFMVRNVNIIKEALISVIFPIINLVILFLGYSFIYENQFLIYIYLIICALLIYKAKTIFSFIKTYKLERYLLLIPSVLIIVLSIYSTKKIIDISSFWPTLYAFNSIIDGNVFDSVFSVMANLLIWGTIPILLLCLKNNKQNSMIYIILLCFFMFFTPLHTGFWNQVNIVYGRNYDIFINPFSFAIAYNWLFTKLKATKFKILTNITIVVALVISVKYFYESQIKNDKYLIEDGYDTWNKMKHTEVEVIEFVKDFIYRNEIEGRKIITSIPQIKTEIPTLQPLFGRWKMIYTDETELEAIFYPSDYFGDPHAPQNPDYKNMCAYINEANYSFIVQDKGIEVYDEEQDIYYSIIYLINECSYPIFENEDYSVYYFE